MVDISLDVKLRMTLHHMGTPRYIGSAPKQACPLIGAASSWHGNQSDYGILWVTCVQKGGSSVRFMDAKGRILSCVPCAKLDPQRCNASWLSS